jgi:hypothetical protein
MRAAKKNPISRPRSDKKPSLQAPKNHVKKNLATDAMPQQELVDFEAEAAEMPSEFGEVDFGGVETATERDSDAVETLPELEREIGIADWIDPETGEPAEGQSPPHLNEE